MGRRRAALALLVLAGCAGPSHSASAPSLEPTPRPTPVPVATPAPTPLPPQDVQVVAVSTFANALSVTLHNPNADVGLVRAEFQIALLGSDGAILGVVGQGGVPGAACCTIYQLPPNGDFIISDQLPASGSVASVEFTLLDDWVPWNGFTAPVATVTGPAVSTQYGIPTLTGRVAVDQPGQFNVWIGAALDQGGSLLGLNGVVDCVPSGADLAFELLGFGDVSGAFAVTEAVAYTTTVPGAPGSPDQPPGC